MKKALRVIVPLVMILAVIAAAAWYFLVYDQALTKQLLLRGARYFEKEGNREISTFLYDVAYSQSSQDDDVAIELSQQYLNDGNYTKAEFTLSQAISNNPSAKLYAALSKVYVDQDKVLDAVELLSAIPDPNIRKEIEEMRPAAPKVTPEPGFYSEYISVTAEAENGVLYLNTDAEYPSVLTDRYKGPITLDIGETVIYAIAVTENGLVSPITVCGYTIGGVVELVEFKDPIIEQMARDILQVGPRDPIYTNQLWPVKELTLSEKVTSFEDLSVFPHLNALTIAKGATGDLSVLTTLQELEYLSLTEVRLSEDDMTVIGGLTHLKHLSLPGCSLSSISQLADLTQLEYLDLSKNTLRNINILGEMKNLKELYLANNAITSLDALSGLTEVETLDVSYNSIHTLEPLRGMYNTMTVLLASHNQLDSINGIPDLQKIKKLDLSHNQISDVTALILLAEMNELDLSNNALTSIRGFEMLMQLQRLKLAHNEITELPPFQATCQLVTIDISYNQITELEPLAGLPWLNSVNVDYNTELESLLPLDSCPLLVKVNAYGTKVTDVSFLTAKSIIVNFNPTYILEAEED